MNRTAYNSTDGVWSAQIPLGDATAHFVTAHASENTLSDVFGRVQAELRDRDATIALQVLFGGRRFHDQATAAMGQPDWPVTLLHGDACSGENLTGMQFVALSGADLQPVMDGGRKVGHWFDTDDARYCLLGDIRADDLSLSREEQAEEVFLKMERLLKKAGMAFADTVRTWLYLNQLLEWYDALNEVRSRFFEERGIFDRLVPASTGIGAGSAAGEAMVAALLAVKPKNDKVKAVAVPSPLQCPALDYKSSFSRAVEVQQPGSRLLMISGTASIEPGGATVHVDSTARQIELSMQVVQEILESRGMGWEHVVRSIVYFKDAREAHLLNRYCAENHLPVFPFVVSHADVCRHDLLFEIELDAVKVNA